LRTAARFTFEEAHDRLEMSDTTLNRIERGTTGVGVHTVKSMLDLYGVGAQEWEPILALVREANRKGWWTSFGLTNKHHTAFETAATRVRTFSLGYLHGLLQAEGYMEAVLRAELVPRSEAQFGNQVEIRRIRQQRLRVSDDPLHLVAVIDESALRRRVGGTAVFRAQLLHLLEMAELSTVRLQVLPADVGVHLGLFGSFSVLEFGDPEEPDVGFYEHITGPTFLNREAEVRRCRLVLERLSSQALTPADSALLISRIAEGVLGELAQEQPQRLD
jgi:transcriptional regulator with XRE-family HTH domain